ncbi:MAG: ABC transporter ATP-binding protein [Clostridia bacterium]
MSVLVVKDLGKSYENFALCDVSFALEDGKITGFIGRNGAGKSTVLKSMLNFVHPDKGEVFFFGKRYRENEQAIKQEIGFVAGGIDYYPKKKLRTITETTKRFYTRWDDDAYARYLALFHLDERKTPDQLSEGMKVKYALALALSHRARLLILDEPTASTRFRGKSCWIFFCRLRKRGSRSSFPPTSPPTLRRAPTISSTSRKGACSLATIWRAL